MTNFEACLPADFDPYAAGVLSEEDRDPEDIDDSDFDNLKQNE